MTLECVRAWVRACVCMPWIHQLLLVCFLENKIHTFKSITETKCVYVTSNISCTYLPNETETSVLVTSNISCTYLPNETETNVLVTSTISCAYLPNETETNASNKPGNPQQGKVVYTAVKTNQAQYNSANQTGEHKGEVEFQAILDGPATVISEVKDEKDEADAGSYIEHGTQQGRDVQGVLQKAGVTFPPQTPPIHGPSRGAFP